MIEKTVIRFRKRKEHKVDEKDGFIERNNVLIEIIG